MTETQKKLISPLIDWFVEVNNKIIKLHDIMNEEKKIEEKKNEDIDID